MKRAPTRPWPGGVGVVRCFPNVQMRKTVALLFLGNTMQCPVCLYVCVCVYKKKRTIYGHDFLRGTQTAWHTILFNKMILDERCTFIFKISINRVVGLILRGSSRRCLNCCFCFSILARYATREMVI